MPVTLEDLLAKRPVNRQRVDILKHLMITLSRAYKLRELREAKGLTQNELAERIGVSQRQVSKIEHGDLDSTKIGTIRSYLEAVGGELELDFVVGDARIQVA